MLGLSQGVSSSAAIFEQGPLVSYTSDFSSSADGFQAYDAIGDAVDTNATLTPNVDFGGKTDVLKITWSSTEGDGFFYLRKSFPDLDDQDNTDNFFTFSAEIYYDFTTSGDVSTLVQAGHIASGNNTVIPNTNVQQGQWVTISQDKLFTSTTFNEYLYIGFFDQDDKPQSGDEMYITNISFTFQDIG